MASIRVCARRSRAEATSSIALVILRVFLTERTRRFRSWTEATELDQASFVLDGEVGHEALQLLVQLRRQLVPEVVGLLDLPVDRLLRAQMVAQLVLEARHLRRRHLVEVAVDAGVERDHLLGV